MTIGLTVVFVALYVAGIFGVGGTPNDPVIKLLQPIVYVIMGYFFGRLPADATEKSLQANAQTLRQDASKMSKEADTARQKQVALEEKIRHVKAVLTASAPEPSQGVAAFAKGLTAGTHAVSQEALRHAVASALSILES